MLVTDTVGFVRNLPHGLVEAFKATLEEAAEADLLVHVVDASDPECEIQYETTQEGARRDRRRYIEVNTRLQQDRQDARPDAA